MRNPRSLARSRECAARFDRGLPGILRSPTSGLVTIQGRVAAAGARSQTRAEGGGVGRLSGSVYVEGRVSPVAARSRCGEHGHLGETAARSAASGGNLACFFILG